MIAEGGAVGAVGAIESAVGAEETVGVGAAVTFAGAVGAEAGVSFFFCWFTFQKGTLLGVPLFCTRGERPQRRGCEASFRGTAVGQCVP